MDNNNDKRKIFIDEGWQYISSLFVGANIIDGILTAEIDYYHFKIGDTKFKEVTEILLDIIVLSGELNITIDNKEWLCRHDNNNYVSIKPLNRLQNIEISKDFKGYAIALSRKFIMKYNYRPYPIPIERIMEMRFYPIFTFDFAVTNNLLSILMKVHRNFSRDVFCKKELIMVSVAEFEVEKMIVQMGMIDIISTKSKKSRQMKLCVDFCELVFENCRKNHGVSFYADKLCITTQYLTRILQENYSRSAKEIIDHAIISEAVVMLHSDLSLQQIAYKLNFSDQSSFGKFFKKITNTTPSSFREQENKGNV